MSEKLLIQKWLLSIINYIFYYICRMSTVAHCKWRGSYSVNGDPTPSVWTFLTTLSTIYHSANTISLSYEWEQILKASNAFKRRKKKDQGNSDLWFTLNLYVSNQWDETLGHSNCICLLYSSRMRKGTLSSLPVALKSKSEREYEAVTEWPMYSFCISVEHISFSNFSSIKE